MPFSPALQVHCLTAKMKAFPALTVLKLKKKEEHMLLKVLQGSSWGGELSPQVPSGSSVAKRCFQSFRNRAHPGQEQLAKPSAFGRHARV